MNPAPPKKSPQATKNKLKNFLFCFEGFFLTIFTPAPFQGQLSYPLGVFQGGAQLNIHVNICED